MPFPAKRPMPSRMCSAVVPMALLSLFHALGHAALGDQRMEPLPLRLIDEACGGGPDVVVGKTPSLTFGFVFLDEIAPVDEAGQYLRLLSVRNAHGDVQARLREGPGEARSRDYAALLLVGQAAHRGAEELAQILGRRLGSRIIGRMQGPETGPVVEAQLFVELNGAQHLAEVERIAA